MDMRLTRFSLFSGEEGYSVGEEFSVAISEARKCGAKILLGDRPVKVRPSECRTVIHPFLGGARLSGRDMDNA